MMVHLTKEKSEVRWGVRGACFYTKKFLSPKTCKFLSLGSVIPHSNVLGISEPIANYEQFLLFPQCFQKTCSADRKKKRDCLGKGES